MPLQAQEIQWESVLIGENHTDDKQNTSAGIKFAYLTPGEQSIPIQGYLPHKNQTIQASCSDSEPNACENPPRDHRIALKHARKLLQWTKKFRWIAYQGL